MHRIAVHTMSVQGLLLMARHSDTQWEDMLNDTTITPKKPGSSVQGHMTQQMLSQQNEAIEDWDAQWQHNHQSSAILE